MLFALLALPLVLSLAGLYRWAWVPVLAALALPWFDPVWAHPGTSFTFLPGLNLAIGVQTAREVGLLRVLLWVYLAVHGYSLFYLDGQPGKRRYFGLLGLFLLGMATLMASQSWLAILLGWETIGLASFGLVSHYRDVEGTGRQAAWVFWVNRLGDLSLITGVSLALAHSPWAIYALVGAAVVKSAQFPFSVWLPWAMVGPTPVSALLHAATLVVSGVVLLTHPLVQPLLVAQPDLCAILTSWAAATALISACAACRATNLKRLLAYSTLAHVALMMLWPYVDNGAASLGHLGTHAFFKTGLFLALGLLHTYDAVPPAPWRQVWATLRTNPWALASALAVILFGAALLGLPPFAAHASKAAILFNRPAGLAWQHPWIGTGQTLFSVLYIGLTAVYVLRFVTGYAQSLAAHLPAPGKVRAQALIILALLPFLFWQPFSLSGELTVRYHAYPSAHFLDMVTWLALLGVLLWTRLRKTGALVTPSPETSPIAISNSIEALSTSVAGMDHALGKGLVNLQTLIGKTAQGIAHIDGQWALGLIRLVQGQVIVAWLLAAFEKTILQGLRMLARVLIQPLRWLVDDQGHLAPGRVTWLALAIALTIGILIS